MGLFWRRPRQGHSVVGLRASAGMLVISAATLALAPGSAVASSGTGTKGYDISYPQCGSSYPSGAAFGIVGVNHGLANNANPCLSSELSWATASPGLTSPAQPPASFYLNTADPGPAVADWPRSGSSTTYGACDGSWSTACAYLYGEQRASYSYGLAASAASQESAAGLPSTTPASDPWWIDIETVNSWATSSDSASWTSLNIAAIRGFVDGLQAVGVAAPIGFYSTASQWHQITGLTATTSPPYFPSSEPDWVGGGRSLKQARTNCANSFTGAPARLAQYRSGGYDADLACS